MLHVGPGLVRQKRHGGPQATLGRVVHDIGFQCRLVASRRVESLQPRHPVVQAVGADVPRIAVVVHLADACHIIAIASEHLRKRHHVGQVLAEMILQIEHPRAVRAQTGQERGAARTAQRKLAVRPFEPHATRSETVDARRLHQRVAVAAEVVVHVVHGDEQDIGPGAGCECRPGWHQRAHNGNEADQRLHGTILLHGSTDSLTSCSLVQHHDLVGIEAG
jgi:hypothetical protein